MLATLGWNRNVTSPARAGVWRCGMPLATVGRSLGADWLSAKFALVVLLSADNGGGFVWPGQKIAAGGGVTGSAAWVLGLSLLAVTAAVEPQAGLKPL